MSKRSLIGILGLGIFGRTIAKTLSHYDVDVIAVDQDEGLLKEYADLFYETVIGDITDQQLLEDIGIKDCQAVVVATGSNLEASSIAVLHLHSFGIPTIVCKAATKSYAQILQAIGANQIVMPEKESGRRLAKALIQESITEVLDLDNETSVINFLVPDKWVGKDLNQLDLRNKYQINIIGIRQSLDQSINTDISGSTVVQDQMILVAIAKDQTIEELDFLNAL